MTDARGQTVQVRLGATATDGRDAEFAATGKTIHHPGFLRAYVEGSDDPEGDLEDQERILPDMAEGDRVDRAEHRGQGPRDPAPRPLHRGLARPAHGGARRGPAVDLRLDHRHHPGPRLRLEEGLGPRPVLHRLRRGHPARGPLPRPRRLRLHRPHGGRARRDRQRHRRADPLAEPLLLRRGRQGRRRRRPAGHGGAQPRRHRRPGGQLHPDRGRRRRRRDRGPPRPLRPVPAAGRGHRVDPRGPAARRAHARRRPSSSWRPPATTGWSARTPRPA